MKCQVENCQFEVEGVREMIFHSRDEHETVLEPCHEEGCEGRLFTAKQLRQHHRSYHIGITTCPFPRCLEEFPSLNSVSTHIHETHKLEKGLHEAAEEFAEDQEGEEIGVLEKHLQLGPPTPQEDLLNNGYYLIHYLTADMHPGYCFQYLTKRNLDVLEDLPEVTYYADDDLPLKQVTPCGMKSTGQECGHMAPKAKYRFCTEAYKSTFAMRNIMPMTAHINVGLWNAVDEHFSDMLRNDWKVSCYVGPIYANGYKVVAVPGGYKIRIPTHFFHANLCERTGEPAFTQNFILPNEMQEARSPIWSYRKSLEEVNHLSGYDFFALQPAQAKIASYEIGREGFRCIVQHCYKTFLSKPQLTQHERTHESSYRCVCCNTIWQSYAEYRICMESHRTLRCTFQGCNKSFQNQYQRTEHLRKHAGEKPFVCDVEGCGQSFYSLGDLINHKRSHSEDRPYICLRCNAGFKASGNLYRHVRGVEGEEPDETNTIVPNKRRRFN